MTVDHDKIKQILATWACYRGCTRMPAYLKGLNGEIRRLSPQSVRILELQYCDSRPQKTKAAQLRMSRQMFSARLRFIHEQLAFSLWGNSVS